MELKNPFKYIDKIHRADNRQSQRSIESHNGDGRQRRNTANQMRYVELVAVNDKRAYDLIFNANLSATENHIVSVRS